MTTLGHLKVQSSGKLHVICSGFQDKKHVHLSSFGAILAEANRPNSLFKAVQSIRSVCLHESICLCCHWSHLLGIWHSHVAFLIEWEQYIYLCIESVFWVVGKFLVIGLLELPGFWVIMATNGEGTSPGLFLSNWMNESCHARQAAPLLPIHGMILKLVISLV